MDTYLKRRIEHITEADFWSSMRVSAGVKDAIAAGEARRKAQAYRLLGEYHVKTLANEAADFAATDAREARDKATAKVIRERADRTMRHEIAGWHTHVKQFGKVIDFNADFGVSGQYGFHYLGWLTPVLQEYVRGGGAKYRNGFLEIIKQYYGQRAKIKRRIPALHPVYYELGAWTKTGLMLPAYATLVGDGALDVKSREAMLKLLLGFARSLYRIAEPGYQAGNWQIVGCAGLYWIGAAFPEFKEAAAWRGGGHDFFAGGVAGFLPGGGWRAINTAHFSVLNLVGV